MAAIPPRTTIYSKNRPPELEIPVGLENRSSIQSKWIPKLMGYDFLVEYKKEKDNLVSNGLSRQGEGTKVTLCMISFPILD